MSSKERDARQYSTSDINYAFISAPEDNPNLNRKKRKSEDSYVCPERINCKPQDADKYYGLKYGWIYRTLDRYGNCFVSVDVYKHLSMKLLGKHTKRFLPAPKQRSGGSKVFTAERDGWIVERVKNNA